MDGQRFDDLARLIASGSSRRGVLKLLGGAVGGGLGALLLRRGETTAQCANPQQCDEDGECCDGFVCDPSSLACIAGPACAPDGDACADPSECCSSDCLAGVCVGCRVIGDPCEGTSPCCGGGVCLDDACVPCRTDATACLSSFECCSGNCAGGLCVACLGDGAACDGETCCDGVCREGVCSTCTADGEDCFGDTCCDGHCFGGFCNACSSGEEVECDTPFDCCSATCLDLLGGPTVCIDCRSPGVSCSSGAECCSGECAGGVCTPYPCNSFGSLDECALGQYCFDGLCVFEAPSCEGDPDCAAGAICCGGYCRRGACCTDDPDPDARCPDGLVCDAGVCQETTDIPCLNDGDTCAADADCCGALVCAGGICGPVDDGVTPVVTPGVTPDATTVPTATGPVTALPSTGVGVGVEGNRDSLLGITLAAGAAALLAGNRLGRPQAEPVEE